MTEDFVLTGERAALGPLRRERLPSFARSSASAGSRASITTSRVRSWASSSAGGAEPASAPTPPGRTRLGFMVLGLHNVMLETYEFNDQARRAYERAGFG